MKKQESKKLSLLKKKVANLHNPSSILGGDDLTTETRTKPVLKCIKTSKEWVPVLKDD